MPPKRASTPKGAKGKAGKAPSRAASAEPRGRSASPAPAASKAAAGKRKASGGGGGGGSPSAASADEDHYLGIGGKDVEYEFGGPWGVLALMLWSHYILFYFWWVELFLCASLLTSFFASFIV